MKAKKSLGQHFLTNPRTAERIAEAVSPDTRTIIEIGPGRGILTRFLVPRESDLILIEKDDALAEELGTEFRDSTKVRLVHNDVLKVDLSSLSEDRDISLVGNFPYNISSQIVFQMLDHKEAIGEMVGMFQLEMAQRIVSGPGSKAYGVISVLTQTAYTGKILFHVSPGQFNPPPKVQSAVIRLERKPNLELPCDYRLLRKVVKMAFLQRRKMLRNTLKPLLTESDALSTELFTRRPEHLSLDDFYNITNLVAEYEHNQKT